MLNIIGISCRTSNYDDLDNGKIGELWTRLFSQNLIAQIPNKMNSDIYSIYTDYESGYTGQYTCLVGVRVSSFEDIPEGMVGRSFPEEKFQEFTAKGNMPEAVINTWMDIWNNDANLNRKYHYDYELYNADSNKGPESVVTIHVGIKE